jgi:hypothetical protein
MRRGTSTKLGLIGLTSLIVLVLIFGVMPQSHIAAPSTPATVSSHLAPTSVRSPVASSHPAVTGPISIATTFTSKFSTNGYPYFTLPYKVTWHVAVTNATIDANFSQVINVSFINSIFCPLFFPCLQVYQDIVNPAWVANATATSGDYYYPLTFGNLTGATYLGFGLPQGQWIISVWDHYDDGIGDTANTEADQSAYMSPVAPFAQIESPSVTNLSQGSQTIAGNWSGYFVSTANVTVYNSTGGVVLTSPVYAPGTGSHAFAVSWAAVTAGNYRIVLLLTTVYRSNVSAEKDVTVVQGFPVTYFNSTGGSLIPGLGAGGSAALLITVGAIVGMIVMALVGRGMWGGSKPAPAQPWSPQSGGMGGGSEGMSGGSGGTSDSGMGGQNPPS